MEAIEVHDDLIDKGFEVIDAKLLRNGQGTTVLWLVALGKGGAKHADDIFDTYVINVLLQGLSTKI